MTIPGVGAFRFNRKNYGAQIKIDAAIARVLGPNALLDMEPDGPLPSHIDGTMMLHAQLIGLYSSLMVDCPAGWENLEEIDLTTEPEKDKQILAVYVALKEKLDSFRVGAGVAASGAQSQGDGAGAASDAAALGS